MANLQKSLASLWKRKPTKINTKNLKEKISELSKESKTNLTNKTSSIEINPLRIENSLKNKQQQQQQQQQQPKQQLPQNKSPNKEKLTSQNHLGNKSTRSKKTKVLPKAKNKADTKHKVNKNNRTVPDTLAEMKVARIENPYKKTTPEPQSVQIQKGKEIEGNHMEEEKLIRKFPTNRVVPKQIH